MVVVEIDNPTKYRQAIALAAYHRLAKTCSLRCGVTHDLGTKVGRYLVRVIGTPDNIERFRVELSAIEL